MKDHLPGKTETETRQYLTDRGHRIAAAQAYRYLGRLIEADDNYPLPPDAGAVIALAASAMKDIHDRRTASLDAYVAGRVAAIHAAVAGMQQERRTA